MTWFQKVPFGVIQGKDDQGLDEWESAREDEVAGKPDPSRSLMMSRRGRSAQSPVEIQTEYSHPVEHGHASSVKQITDHFANGF